MNQSKAFLTSLICAGGGFLLVWFYVSDKESSIKSEFGNEVPVVVAARDINEFEQFQDNMLRTITMPKKFAHESYIKDIKDLTTSGAVAAAPFRTGEPVSITKVLLKGAETGLASQIAIAHRGVSIPVSDVTGVTKLLKPGDRVDVVSNVAYQGPNGQESEVKTLLQNVHVLAVGEVIQNQIPSVFEDDPLTGSKRAVNLRGSRAFSTVTLEVTPTEAQSLIFVVQSGTEMYLTLRNPIDRVVASIPTTTVDEVLGPTSKKAQKARPVYVAPPPRAVAPAPPPGNPWSQGGSSFAK